MKNKTSYIILAAAGFSAFGYFALNRSTNVNIEKNPIQAEATQQTSSVSTAQHVSDISTPSTELKNQGNSNPRKLITEEDLENRFLLPDPSKVDLSAYITQLLSELKNDKSGDTHLKIAKVLEFCESAPQNEAELADRKKVFEKYAGMNGQDNGQVQNGASELEHEYKMCLDIKKQVSGETAYTFYKNSAEAGHPFAKVDLATNVYPPNYDSLSKEQVTAYQEKMGKLLDEARQRCEPTAFKAFGFGSNSQIKKLWVEPEGAATDLNRYANMFAHNIFYVRNVANGDQKIPAFDAELKAMFPRFSDADIKEARDLGASMFNKYCTTSND